MDDIIKPRGTTSNYKDNRGGAVLLPHPVIGIVKNNIDPTHSGRVQVYINRLNHWDQDNPAYWTTVSYLSPFFGYTQNTSAPDGEGKYKSNSHAYGFWATPPDIGTEVVCVFVNGDINFGYYIGCIPQAGLTHMVPAMGSSSKIVANDSEAQSYGGATELPVTEYNDANNEKDNQSELVEQARTVHSYQASRLNIQGLVRDPDRGTITSSATRESPSNVFGMSTPGRPYYKGGYTDESIEGAVKNEGTPDENFKIVGRKGGHSIVMDDGDLTGKNQLMRFRSGTGHMILMQDKAETFFIVHANGKSYIEMNKEGAIDIYCTNSVNLRTHGDINIHAERDINMFAKRNFNLKAEKINLESVKDTLIRVGENFKTYTLKKYTVKVDDAMAFESKSDAGFTSKANIFVTGGPNINLNTGSSPTTPEEVEKLPVIKHTDTLYEKSKGFTPAPNKIESINSRVPAHSPWTEANKGVDVKVDMGSDSNLPASPPAEVASANESVPGPSDPTSPAMTNTVPPVAGAAGEEGDVTNAMVSQDAINAANIENPGADALGEFNQTPEQLEGAGCLKPGTGSLAKNLLDSGYSPGDALPPSMWTGQNGIGNYDTYLNNISAQTNIQSSLYKNAKDSLVNNGILSGLESLTQTAGIIMATAAAGLPLVASFMASRTKPGVTINPAVTAAAAAANGNTAPPSTPVGTIPSLVSSGNYAATMATTVMSGVNPQVVTPSLQGPTASAFNAVLAGYKPFKAGVPQNLAQIKKEQDEANAVKYGPPTASNTAEGTDINSLVSIPGGSAAFSNTIDPDFEKTAQLSPEMEALADQAMGAPTSVNTAELLSKLKSGTTNLENIAYTGMDPTQASITSSVVNSITGGTGVKIKIPISGVKMSSNKQLEEQTAKVLEENYTVQTPNQPSSATQSSTTNPATTAAQLQQSQRAAESLREKYNKLKANLGPMNPSTIEAYESYKEAVKNVQNLQ